MSRKDSGKSLFINFQIYIHTITKFPGKGESQVLVLNEQEFVRTMKGIRCDPLELQTSIRTALVRSLGELPAMAALAYTGDAEDGDLVGFAQRTQELFGPNASVLLSNIVMSASKRP
jgi:hypothetical protein